MAYKMVGYFENWAQYRGDGWEFKPEQINPSLYTHINLAFADFGFISPGFPDKGGPSLTGNHKVLPHEWNDEDELYPALQKLKRKNPNLKTLISIGGWNFNEPNSKYSGKWTHQLFSKMAASRSSRQEFIKSAINFAQKHGFDGIDVDWEYPGDMRQGGNVNGADDFGNYLTLLAELRNAISGKNLLLTIAAPAIVTTGVPNNSPYKKPQKYFQWLGNCAKYLDWLNIMAYDYHGAFDSQTGVLAPLLEDSVPNGEYCLKNTIDAYLNIAKIPAKKLVLGIPTYGRTFKVSGLASNNHEPNKPSKGPGSAGSATKEPGVLAYYEIKQRLSNNELTRVWHKSTHTPYAYSSTTGEWVTYEDEKSVCYKTSYLISKSLGGAMIWAIAQDDFKQGFPLQRKIKEILENPAKGCPIIPDSSSSKNPLTPSISDYSSGENPLTPFILKESNSLYDFVDIVVEKIKTDKSPIVILLLPQLPSYKDLDKYFHHVEMSGSHVNLIRPAWLEIKQAAEEYGRDNSHSVNLLQKLESLLGKLISLIEPLLDKNPDGWKLVPFYQVAALFHIAVLLESLVIDFLSFSWEFPQIPSNSGNTESNNQSSNNKQNTAGNNQPSNNKQNQQQDENVEQCELKVEEIIQLIDHLIEILTRLRKKWGDKDIGPVNEVLEGDKIPKSSKPREGRKYRTSEDDLTDKVPESDKAPKSSKPRKGRKYRTSEDDSTDKVPKGDKAPKSSSEDKYSYFVKMNFNTIEGKDAIGFERKNLKITIEFYSEKDKEQKFAKFSFINENVTKETTSLSSLEGIAEFNYDVQWLVEQKWRAYLEIILPPELPVGFLLSNKLRAEASESIAKMPVTILFKGERNEDIGEADISYGGNLTKVRKALTIPKNRNAYLFKSP